MNTNLEWKNMKNSKGFTLLEVIVVLAIIGIAAAIAIPNIISWVPNYQLKGAARNLYSHMQRAKSEAVKANESVTFNFTSGTGVPCQGGGYVFTTSGGVTVVNEVMGPGLCLSTPTNFPNGFFSNGLPSGATGTIRLTHQKNNRTYDVTQTIAGAVRLQ